MLLSSQPLSLQSSETRTEASADMMAMSAEATETNLDEANMSAYSAALAPKSKPGTSRSDVTGMERAMAATTMPKARLSKTFREAQPRSDLRRGPTVTVRVAKYGPSEKYPKAADPQRKGGGGEALPPARGSGERG